ncbi:hypothetical protein O988_06638 [Pseudogymnoascus sp. VKM F-3808]|nr:hypothetical protein O988_06638 [Pseudogymnoascus sp. VKM F-3808]
MLSLTDLPPEILLTIATFVGGEYLRDRTERLLLCKAWYQAAHDVAFGDAVIDIEALQLCLAKPHFPDSLVRTRSLFIRGKPFYKGLNLSMAEGGFYAAVNARYCEEDKYEGKPIYPHMKELAKTAAVRFPSITTMRLLCINPRTPGSSEICHNVLSDREVLLPDGVRWDDLGWNDVDAEPAPPPPSEHSDSDNSDNEASNGSALPTAIPAIF